MECDLVFDGRRVRWFGTLLVRWAFAITAGSSVSISTITFTVFNVHESSVEYGTPARHVTTLSHAQQREVDFSNTHCSDCLSHYGMSRTRREGPVLSSLEMLCTHMKATIQFNDPKLFIQHLPNCTTNYTPFLRWIDIAPISVVSVG